MLSRRNDGCCFIAEQSKSEVIVEPHRDALPRTQTQDEVGDLKSLLTQKSYDSIFKAMLQVFIKYRMAKAKYMSHLGPMGIVYMPLNKRSDTDFLYFSGKVTPYRFSPGGNTSCYNR